MPHMPAFFAASVGLVFASIFMLGLSRPRKQWSTSLGPLVLVFLGVTLSICASGGGGSSHIDFGTPAGSYAVAFSAAGGGTTQKPTRHELIKLAEYWQGVAIDRAWYFFVTGQSGSSDWRLKEFALCRIDRIWESIGEEATRQAIESAHAKCQQDGRDARLWDIFLRGDEEEWKAVANETFPEMEKDIPARSPQTEPPREETDES